MQVLTPGLDRHTLSYMRRNKILKTGLFIILLLLFTGLEILFARAGGGGSRSGSGGGGGDLGALYLIFYLIRILPFPLNIIVIGIILFALFRGSRKVRDNGSAFRSVSGEKDSTSADGFTDFIIHNPDFSEEVFFSKVQKAFLAVQNAWTSKKIAQARRFITDGVYQRFTTQIKMMELLKQTDRISDIKIKNIWIDRVEEDGEYDIIHTGIQAYMKDFFSSELSASLNSRVDGEFIEYWSFIRRKNSKNKDLYSTVTCPNCNAPLKEEHLDVVKCPFCGTLLNNGEYDWVLSEITQANDYAASRRSIRKIKSIVSKLSANALSGESSIQLLEDKASNGYLQILTAAATGDMRGIKRFTTEAFAQKLKNSQGSDTIAYNRLYLSDVTLVGASRTDELNRIFISIRSTFQRIIIRDGKLVKKLDPFMISKNEIMVLQKKVNSKKPKGSLYAGSCPSCGAAVEDPFAVKCPYCGVEYNREDMEWIASDILSMEEYAQISGRTDTTTVNPDILDAVYDVRDYALNNMMMIIAADGIFDRRERELAEMVARKFGYRKEHIQSLFSQAEGGKLSIRMPENRGKRKKIYSLLVKTAMADKVLSSEEKDILDNIKEMYLSA